jgi:hypothetical protein
MLLNMRRTVIKRLVTKSRQQFTTNFGKLGKSLANFGDSIIGFHYGEIKACCYVRVFRFLSKKSQTLNNSDMPAEVRKDTKIMIFEFIFCSVN